MITNYRTMDGTTMGKAQPVGYISLPSQHMVAGSLYNFVVDQILSSLSLDFNHSPVTNYIPCIK